MQHSNTFQERRISAGLGINRTPTTDYSGVNPKTAPTAQNTFHAPQPRCLSKKWLRAWMEIPTRDKSGKLYRELVQAGVLKRIGMDEIAFKRLKNFSFVHSRIIREYLGIPEPN